MGIFATAEELIASISAATTPSELTEALAVSCLVMGFQYFALSHHVDQARCGDTAIRLHNYPDRWAEFYDANRFAVSDPVHRASHVTSVGFAWSQMPQMIPLTARDVRILALGSAQGIGDGFTIPANVPGEARGSCTFANAAGRPLRDEMLPLAQLLGAFAFEAARRIWAVRTPQFVLGEPLTDRQRDCLLWIARGKSDWETSRILGISKETVSRHLKDALDRKGVRKRTLLAILALSDGTLSFTDIFRP